MTDWTQKLAAWLHDPAEKQLVLMRDPVGHEGGSIVEVGKALGLETVPAWRKERGQWIKQNYDKLKQGKSVEHADHLAAAADRPNWPRGDDAPRYPQFEAVRFAKEAELIHPLSGARLKPGSLDLDISVDQIKTVSQNHFESLIQDDDDDLRKTFLAFWRFGPEAGRHASELGVLWPMLPADSRTPDHSIWSHVDTVAAIHTALAGDADGPDQPALLAMSFGPVQGFIGQARSTSDLWAGSHLLASLVWEAMKPVVEQLGPDAVLFPALRGVPAVDRWLVETGGAAFRTLFEGIDAEFLQDKTDTNPLFAAALPNKFVAIVPARQAEKLAEAAIAAVRKQAKQWTLEAAQAVFEVAGANLTDETHAQIAAQLDGFPEAYWAASTWPAEGDLKDVAGAAKRLHTALDLVHPDLKTQGIFDAKVWPVLTKELKLDDLQFRSPNTGLLYPAVYELADRALAAAKATRPFNAMREEGFRCTLSGEAEWLTDSLNYQEANERAPTVLHVPSRARADITIGERKGTVWSYAVGKFGIKKGEHLGALATLKRLWPTLFARQIGEFLGLGEGEKVRRYVVSTHALALSTSIDRLLDGYGPDTLDKLTRLSRDFDFAQDDPVTLPKALHARIRRETNANAEFVLKRLPAALDRLRDAEDRSPMDKAIKELFGEDNKPETYYALILMDGDRMGGWLAGNEDEYKLAYRDTWHSKVRAEMDKHTRGNPDLTAYLNTLRPVSPARHASISRALNDFSTHLARHIIEDCCKGKLLYAGGDDVLALVAVDDLFDAMQLLRLAYSGIAPDEAMNLSDRIGALRAGGSARQNKLLLAEGFGLLNGRLMTLMGHQATASMGAVVAHHTAPLSMVLRELRAAENTAKSAGRDRFHLRVLKRGGGEVSVVSPWWVVESDKTPNTAKSALALMKQLAVELALTEFSRGAIYRSQLWFEGLTDDKKDADDPRWRAQITGALAAQFNRQRGNPEIAKRVVDYVCEVMRPEHPKTAIDHFLVTSEFFAREARAIQMTGKARRESKQEAA
ncbi:MAG: type III-B CRISPR-associated protein Cas10/Cmr2 [Pseudomonadota bacterium]|nr:type III-B CRISPR-associated protein Cas10/Cmr2 [Pseudomonadota bacterium]